MRLLRNIKGLGKRGDIVPYDRELIDKGYARKNPEYVEKSLTVKELREIAKEQDVKGYSSMKKAELIEAIDN